MTKVATSGERVNGLLLKVTWSCEVEVSHMGKKPISYRQRWEKIFIWLTLSTRAVMCIVVPRFTKTASDNRIPGSNLAGGVIQLTTG